MPCCQCWTDYTTGSPDESHEERGRPAYLQDSAVGSGCQVVLPGGPKHGSHDAVCRLALQALVQGLIVAQEHLLGPLHGTLLPPGPGQEVVQQLHHGLQAAVPCRKQSRC